MYKRIKSSYKASLGVEISGQHVRGLNVLLIKLFFMLNSAEHEISKLDKSKLINHFGKLLTCGDFHRFCLSHEKTCKALIY